MNKIGVNVPQGQFSVQRSKVVVRIKVAQCSGRGVLIAKRTAAYYVGTWPTSLPAFSYFSLCATLNWQLAVHISNANKCMNLNIEFYFSATHSRPTQKTAANKYNVDRTSKRQRADALC